MTPICGEDEIDTQARRGISKRARLIPRRRRQNEDIVHVLNQSQLL